MSCKGNVVEKVWATPELAEKILSFASLESTLSLAQSKLMPRNILEGPSVWNKLIRQSCPLNGPKVEILVQILKRMQNPKAPLLDLLDLICKHLDISNNFFCDCIDQDLAFLLRTSLINQESKLYFAV